MSEHREQYLTNAQALSDKREASLAFQLEQVTQMVKLERARAVAAEIKLAKVRAAVKIGRERRPEIRGWLELHLAWLLLEE